MTINALVPRESVRALDVPLLNGGRFVLGAEPGENFDLLVFYRGLHCPVCAKYLMEFERLAGDFQERGVKLLALSSDTEERAQKMADKIKAKQVPIAYGLSLESAREWGLYISASRGKTSIGLEEPALFSEPGVFMVRPDGTLFYGATQTMPFARPALGDLVGSVDFTLANDYPARGEYLGAV